jgi:hypothetical protein
MPLSINDFEIKTETCANSGIVSGEKSNLFHIFSVFGSIGSSASAGKLTRLGIEGDPLESSSA